MVPFQNAVDWKGSIAKIFRKIIVSGGLIIIVAVAAAGWFSF